MGSYTLKIQGYDSAELKNLNKEIYDSFKFSEFIEKSDTNNEIILKNVFFSEDYKVPNVCRYILKKTNSEWIIDEIQDKHPEFKNSNFNDQPINYRPELPAIVLILESPDQDEYDYLPTFLIPIAPAQGATGKQIFKQFDKIINNNIEELHLKESEYRIIIINPIPFQTSLHYCHRNALKNDYTKIRDFVWSILWNENNTELKNEFSKLIQKINPELIINACTGELSKLLKIELLSSKLDEFSKIKIANPYSWFSKNNRKITLF